MQAPTQSTVGAGFQKMLSGGKQHKGRGELASNTSRLGESWGKTECQANRREVKKGRALQSLFLREMYPNALPFGRPRATPTFVLQKEKIQTPHPG